MTIVYILKKIIFFKIVHIILYITDEMENESINFQKVYPLTNINPETILTSIIINKRKLVLK